MEQIKKLDEELKKTYSYEFQMNQLAGRALMVLGTFCMLLPISVDTLVIRGELLILILFGVHIYLKPYLQVSESGQIISIYQKLKWMPVLKKEILTVRKAYLNRICLKLLFASIILQQIGALLDHSWNFFNLLYPVISIFLVWAMALGHIYVSIYISK